MNQRPWYSQVNEIFLFFENNFKTVKHTYINTLQVLRLTVKMRILVVKRKNKNLVTLTTVCFTRFLEPVIGIGEPRRKNSPLDCFCLRACWLQTSFALDHSFSIPLVIVCIKNAPFCEGCILYGASDRN